MLCCVEPGDHHGLGSNLNVEVAHGMWLWRCGCSSCAAAVHQPAGVCEGLQLCSGIFSRSVLAVTSFLLSLSACPLLC